DPCTKTIHEINQDSEDDDDSERTEVHLTDEAELPSLNFQFLKSNLIHFTPEFLCSEILISIRKNHDAFSRHSKRISNNQINGWEGCKRLGTIPITDGINGIFNSIIQMYISNVHLLIPNGYLIIYSDKKLCIAQIISMYEKRGERHA
ncbi:hypothetical protein RhiirA1_471542, partial [Rhizophagus irregularis]